MTPVAHAGAAAALRDVFDPCSVARNVPLDIVEMGLVRECYVDTRGTAHVRLGLTSITCFQVANITAAIEDALATLPGVSEVEVTVDHTQMWGPEQMSERARERLHQRRAASARLTGVRPQQWRDEPPRANGRFPALEPARRSP